jgi:hypothetical protein
MHSAQALSSMDPQYSQNLEPQTLQVYNFGSVSPHRSHSGMRATYCFPFLFAWFCGSFSFLSFFLPFGMFSTSGKNIENDDA